MAAKPKTNKPMTKSAIAAHLAETVGYSKKQALQTLEEIATLAYKEAKNTFTLPGLGKLILQDRAARVGRNPQTGEPVQIPAKKVVKFRVAKAAKDEILGPSAAKPAPKAAPKKAPAAKK
jgi:DNA-binding protein HU-beta